MLDTPFLVVAAILVGLCAGSFLNVVIYRLPKMLDRGWKLQCAELNGETVPEAPPFNLVVPRSACPSCGHPISAAENIPVVSWIVLRGKCKACRAPISRRYPVVEVLGGLFAAWSVYRFGLTPKGVGAAILLWSLLALTMIDVDTQLLPDDITLPLLWAGLAFNLWGVFAPLASAVIGAIAGYLSLWVVYWLFKLIRGKEGMGYGDFKLLGALGAWLGWEMLPLIVLLSSLAGALVGLGLVALKGRDHSVPLAFGPYLAAAGAVALFWGAPIMRIYLP
jgi:leader peptidase (prepilin peptidase)/N-methyltransferase